MWIQKGKPSRNNNKLQPNNKRCGNSYQLYSCKSLPSRITQDTFTREPPTIYNKGVYRCVQILLYRKEQAYISMYVSRIARPQAGKYNIPRYRRHIPKL